MVSRDAWRNVIRKHTVPMTEEMFRELGYGGLERSNAGVGNKVQVPEGTSSRNDSSRTEERVLQIDARRGFRFSGNVFDISDENFLICYNKRFRDSSEGEISARMCYHIPWDAIVVIKFEIEITRRNVT